MPASHFDPHGFFDFDLKRGAVHARDGKRVMVMTEEVLAALLMAAVQQGDLTAVRRLGGQLGVWVSGSLDEDVLGSAASEVLEHAAGMLAVFGWGRLRIERWGPALALVVEGPVAVDRDRLALAALLGGMVSQLAGREAACVPMEDGRRFLVVDPALAEQVWTWAREGDDLATILSRLEEGVAA